MNEDTERTSALVSAAYESLARRPYYARPVIDALTARPAPGDADVRRLAAALRLMLPEGEAERFVPEQTVSWGELVRRRRYAEAIEALEKENLNNPEKSIYFADQMRFLRKLMQYDSKT